MSIIKVFYRSPNNYNVDEASNECSVKDFGPSMTVQSMAEDADLNVIMKRFGVTGKMPDNVRPVFYGDFDEVFDFRTAQHALIDAQRNFDAMPADLRARFGHDPQQFLEFCSASKDGKTLDNIDEMRKLGLALPKQDVKIDPPKATEEKK